MRTKKSHLALLFLVGALSAFPPFATDLYLPTLPSLTTFFNTNESLVQLSLTMSMIGLACGQLFIGPLSDSLGRKKLLLLSLVCFIIATIFCLLSPNIFIFNICRLLQGMAASGGVVIARSISADRCRGKTLTKFLSVVSIINGVAPIVAPILGGILMSFLDWRGTFFALLLYGILLLLASLRTPESLPENRRISQSPKLLLKTYFNVLKNKEFLTFSAVYTFSACVLFAYIAASPFILQQGYGLSPMAFSICFGINALSIVIGCSIAGKIKNDTLSFKIGGLGIFIFTVLTAFVLYFHFHIIIVEISLMATVFCFGILQPQSNARALNSERKNAGTAAATLGASGFLMGGIVAPLVGLGNIFHSLGIILIIGGTCTAVACIFALKKLSEKQVL